MNEEAKAKIKELVEEAKNILLLVEPSAEETELLSRHALKNTLEQADKKLFLLPEPPKDFENKFSSLIAQYQKPAGTNGLKITIPKNIPLEELSYQEEGDNFSINLNCKNGAIAPQDIKIEQAKPKMDLVFCFSDKQKLVEQARKKLALPDKENLVFLTKNTRTLAEKIYDLRQALNLSATEDKNTATLLYASLIYETNNFQEKTSEAVLELGAKLLKAGADQQMLRAINRKEKTSADAKLLGRALARTHIDSTLSCSWSFLAQKDFQKTGALAEQKTLLNTIKKIRENIQPMPLSFLFWEKEKQIRALVYGENEEAVRPLALELGAALQSQYFISSGFKNFTEAELAMRKLLNDKAEVKIEL